MVELKAITEDNFLDAFRLKLAPGQESFVSHPIRSLAQAYVYRTQCQPFGIYADEKMVGYVMVIYDYDVPEYDVWHMMIDAASQGQGYGSEAMDRVIDYIKTKPFGDSDRVALTCNKDNPVARKLYESRGFSASRPAGHVLCAAHSMARGCVICPSEKYHSKSAFCRQTKDADVDGGQ